jgi:protein-tyrosine phosphatase
MTIISIGIEAQPPKNKIPPEIDHHAYDIHDNKQQKISVELLDEVFEIIEKGRIKGGVLVHCYAGVSRSSSFVIAYLIRKYLLSYD